MHTFILDIGKTNIKGSVLDDNGQTRWSASNPNTGCRDDGYDYPCMDVENIWDWFKSALREAASRFRIDSINVSTHGACAVLLSQEDELLFPVMDYEVDRLVFDSSLYPRPGYARTQSPDLPGGLNLGRQIWWLKETYPERFSQLGTLLLYPQYWVWKLTGCAVSEVTSLGCHTDLWEPLNRRYSSLVSDLGIEQALPAMVDGFNAVGSVRQTLARELGLPESCAVYPGVHDSNASLARYLASDMEAPFTVISTGTWVIAMALGNPGDSLMEARDMLANVDVYGRPVPCARFMGGREFEKICKLTGVATDEPVTREGIQSIVADAVFALPPLETGSGPFMHSKRVGGLTGEVVSGVSLATLYLALMIDYELDLLNTRGPILFGSASLKNPLLCQLLSQLRPQQPVYISNDNASTIMGAWCLTRRQQDMPSGFSDFEISPSAQIGGLPEYRDDWRARAVCD
ncbi:MAG: FGGY-family carbohydrate kinase [Porticoccaceae bacterium]